MKNELILLIGGWISLILSWIFWASETGLFFNILALGIFGSGLLIIWHPDKLKRKKNK